VYYIDTDDRVCENTVGRFATVRLLGLRVRIPPGAWILSLVNVVCCAGSDGLIP
jgi:hypothetical protein